MAITDTQKDNMLGIIVGLFNASPGRQFFDDFSKLIDTGTTEAQLADILATSTAFTSGIMGGNTTVAAQVTELMNHYGLIADNVPGSPATQAEAFFTNSIISNVGFGAIALQATSFLLGASVPAEFTQTANLFKNKIAVADAHSAVIISDNLDTLQAPMFDLDGSTVLTPAEVTAYLVTNSFIFSVNTSSVTLNSPLLVGPIGAIGVPDAFTVNIVGAGSPLNIDSGFSVTPLDAAGTTVGGNAETFTLNATGDINAQTVIANGIENLIISSTVNLAARFIAPDAEAITITGSGNVDLEANTSALSDMTIGKVSAINAAGSTGSTTINFSAHAQTVTFAGSSGRDVYVGSTAGDTITGGQGGDWLILETAKTAQDTLVLNAGDARIIDTTGDGKITILEEADFEMVDNFTVGAAATADRFDISSFAFTGSQQGIVNVAAKVPTFDIDLTSIPDLFSDTAGDRGVAYSEIALPPELGVSQTVMFIDENKDGNLTAADDIVIEVMGAGQLDIANFVF